MLTLAREQAISLSKQTIFKADFCQWIICYFCHTNEIFNYLFFRSCLYCETVCHTVTVLGKEDELRIVHKTLLKFFFDLVKGEVEFLTKR